MTPSLNHALGAFACSTMLCVAVWSDLEERRIPNAAVLAGAAVAVLVAAAPGGIGALHALAAMATGLVLLMPLHALRALGGGDVKLFAAVSGYTGVPGLFHVGLYTLLAGGLLCAGWLALSRAHAAGPARALRVPYAVAIALGTGAHFVARAAA